MQLTDNFYKLIKHFEGCKLQPYVCTGGKLTIGYGNTYYPDGRRVKKGDRISLQQAEEMLPIIAEEKADIVRATVRRELLPHEFDAMVSFVYNNKLEPYKTSTLLRKVNANAPVAEIVAQFNRWVYSGGKRTRGLIRRRAAESHLYATGQVNFFLEMLKRK